MKPIVGLRLQGGEGVIQEKKGRRVKRTTDPPKEALDLYTDAITQKSSRTEQGVGKGALSGRGGGKGGRQQGRISLPSGKRVGGERLLQKKRRFANSTRTPSGLGKL